MRSKLMMGAVGLLTASAVAGKIPWDVTALDRTPQTFAVEMACSNEYGRIAGVEPIFVAGEDLKGRPTRVFAWWGLPEGASAAKKVPAMVLVHGGGGTAFASWVKTWNSRGYAAIAMDNCGGIPQGVWDGQRHSHHEWSGPSGWGSSVSQVEEPLRDQWTYHAVAAVMRCHSFLRARPEIDAGRIGLTGISWGGYLASIVGAVDGRFRFAAPVYGCGFYDLNPEWDKHMAADQKLYCRWLALWDPSVFLPSASIPYLWCCGTNDRWYPLDAVRKSYELRSPDAPLNLSIKLRMHHAHPPAGDPPEITALADAMLKGGKPLVDVRAKLSGDLLKATFDAHGRAAVRAEFLSTVSTNALLMAREWTAEPVADFATEGRLSVKVPRNAVMFFVNVIDSEGLVASSRLFER